MVCVIIDQPRPVIAILYRQRIRYLWIFVQDVDILTLEGLIFCNQRSDFFPLKFHFLFEISLLNHFLFLQQIAEDM